MLSAAALALEGGGNLISPDASLAFVFFLFILFVFVLNQLMFKPIGRVLDRRETLTDGARAEARAATRHYEGRLSEYESSLRQARVESYRFLEQRRAEALEERAAIVEQAKQRVAGETELAKSEITRQAAAARAALERDSLQIARQISRTVLGRSLEGGAD